MEWLRFGTLSIGSFTTSILLAVITGYLLALKRKSPDAWYLTGYIGVLCLLLLSYTVRYSVFSPLALATGQVSNLIVFGNVCLIQFAYRYGGDSFGRESRIVLAVSLSLSLLIWGSLFFMPDVPRIYDFTAQYYSYEYGPRISFLTLAGYIWAVAVFARKVALRSGSDDERERRTALSSRSFALLTAATASIALTYLLFQVGAISRAAYAAIFNSGSPLICLAIFIVYINNSSQPVSFVVKLVGIPLAVLMVAFGLTAGAIMPVIHGTLADRYRDNVDQARFALMTRDPPPLPESVAFAVSAASANPYTAAVHVDGLIPERRGLKPAFFYLDFHDPATFYFAYRVTVDGEEFLIGYGYDLFLRSVHRFASRFAVVSLCAAILMVIGFPFAFRRGLLRPLTLLLDGVLQVSSGNYRMRIPVASGDEVGRLAVGYNHMITSLVNAEGNFKALAENANDAILILSKDGSILFANRRAAEISGHTVRTLLGKRYDTFIHPAEIAVVRRKFAERMAGGGGIHSYETRVLHREGRSIPVEITGANTVWQDLPADVVILRDVSERKKTESLIQAQQLTLMRTDKLSSLGALVAGVAHEVNNPNQVVSMNARFLADGLPALFSLAESGEIPDDSMRLAGMDYGRFKEAAGKALSEMESSTRRIDHIVNELKRFVRGGTTGDVQEIDLDDVVKSVTDLSRHMISTATDAFTMELAGDLPPISADRTGIEQVVLNLLQNACQALRRRTDSVSVRTYRDRSEGRVCVEVRDEGVGIPESDLERITDSFFTTKGERGGTGLGLSVSSRIVREHRGTLTFRSKVGSGTAAVVSLPVSSGPPPSTKGDRIAVG